MTGKVTRREQLHEVLRGFEPTKATNIGLWLDKYIEDATHEDKESRATFARGVVKIEIPDEYGSFFKIWEIRLKELCEGVQPRKANVKGRMVLGLGSESVLETSVTLHRTYGVPYIPGSALKGLTAAFARHHCGDDWQPDAKSGYYNVVFGTNNEAGYVTFFDALYVPGSGHNGQPLHFDVMTVHHRGYYEGKTDAGGKLLPPADWDDPNPVPFISATGEYLIALATPEGCEAWRDLAFAILDQALEHGGVGGKTSSGYGRLKLQPAPVDPEMLQAEALLRAINSIPADKLAAELSQQAGALLKSQLSSKYKRLVALTIIKRANDAGKQKKKFAEKAWFAEVQKLLTE